MSSDESVTNGAESQDQSVAVDVQAASPNERAEDDSQSVDRAAETSLAADESSPESAAGADSVAENSAIEGSPDDSSAGDAPRRKLRLNPTVDKSQVRARPTLKPAGSESTDSVSLSGSSSTAQTSDDPTVPPIKVSGSTEHDQSPSIEQSAEVQTIRVEPSTAPSVKESRPPKQEPVEIPPAVSDIDAEMAAEIEAALASGEIGVVPVQTPAETDDEEAASEAAAPQVVTEETLEKGTRLTGRIQSFHGDDVFLDLGLRSPGVVQRRQFTTGKAPEVGQLIEVVVDRVDREEGLILVNLPKGLRKVSSNWESVEVGQIVDCMVTKTNKGGLEVTVSSLRGFLPAGQVDFGFVSDLEPFVGQKLRVKIIDVNPKKRNLVVSRRDYLKIERKEAEKTLWTTLQEGQVLPGKVKTLKDYGAFVDIGGIDGFLHIGEMSWTRLKHPSEAVSEGQPIEVKVLHLDRQKKKISLGMKQLSQNPWATAAQRFAVGSTVTGKVTRATDFGGFVELEPGLEGLIHISELDHKHVRKVADILKVGQSVDAKVLEVDSDRKRISLSLKALLEKPPEAKPDEELSPSGGEAYQRKRKGPLKGGTGLAGGGGLFGNPNDFGK